MGCDGGTIPKRKEVVKNKEQRTRKAETEEQAAERWKNCAISDWFLTKPIVAGPMGHLMSKEAVLEHLIECRKDLLSSHHRRGDHPDVLSSIHSLRDVKLLKLTENTFISDGDGASTSNESAVRGDYVCPITGLETNGRHKFVFSWNCGCVVSERAIKELGHTKCPACQTPCREIDIVIINPAGKELETNQAKFAARTMSAELAKKKTTGSRPASTSRNGSDRAGPVSGTRASQPSSSNKQQEKTMAPRSELSSGSQTKKQKT